MLQTTVALGTAAFVRRLHAASRPNILLITTDQQSADAMSCRIGDQYLKTPHMDSLAANGTLFSRAYCANPLCVPSRTSIFTGRYPVETGVETNDTSPIDANRFPAMGAHFKRAGYTMGYFGKWHLPFAEADTQAHGFEIAKWDKSQRDASTEKGVVNFLRTKRSTPFFAVASFLNPHNICEWARGEKLSEGDIGTPPDAAQCPPWRANHAPQTDEPDAVTTMRHSYQATPTFPVGNFDEKKWRQYLWAYYRLIEKADARIGEVLKALRDTGLDRDTLVVLSADHGDCQGSHGWNQKTILWEEAARVPCILSWKGVTRPEVSDRLVNTGVDFWPTLSDYAGIPAPENLPGISLKSSARREYVVVSDQLAQGAPVNGKEIAPDGRMLRSERFKYTVYSPLSSGGEHREALVDLEKDPGETTNLARDAKFAIELQRHRGLLAAWCRKYGDRFPVVA
jgi:choline-sulfatase